MLQEAGKLEGQARMCSLRILYGALFLKERKNATILPKKHADCCRIKWLAVNALGRYNHASLSTPSFLIESVLMKARPRLSAFPKCYLDQISFERSMSVFDWIEMARQLPAEGLEMYEGFFVDFSDEEADRVADAAHRAGFVIPMLCCSPDFTHPDAKFREAQLQHMVRRIEVSRRLGGPGVICRVLSGQRRPEVSREQGIEWVVDAIRKLLPIAKANQVVLGMENHYKDGFWQYPEFAQRSEIYLSIIEAIDDRENFGVQFDPSNAVVAGESPIELLDKVLHRVVSMHASDRYLEPGHTLEELRQADGTLGYSPILKHGVTGRGLNDYDAIFSRLASIRYHGWISIEDGMDGMEQMAESLRFLKRKVDQYYGSL